MNEDELLECHHCGERNLELQQIDIRQKEGQLVCLLCPDCGASGPTGYCESENENEQFEFAKTLYKERVLPEWLREKIKQLKIDNPFDDIHDMDLNYGYDYAINDVLSLLTPSSKSP